MDDKDEVKKVEPADTDVLFDEADVAGFKVRPWRLKECVSMTPIIEEIKAVLLERHLNFRDFFSMTKEGQTEVLNIDQLIFILIPQLPKVFKITLNVSDEVVQGIPQAVILELMSTIIIQNIEYLKNLFALTIVMAKLLKSAKSSSEQ